MFGGETTKTGDLCAALRGDFNVYRPMLDNLNDKELTSDLNKKCWPMTNLEVKQYMDEGDNWNDRSGRIIVNPAINERSERLVQAFCDLFGDE
jgi:hypothetical protein